MVRWLRETRPDVLFTAPANGFKGSRQARMDAVNMGMNAGVPDLCVFEPRAKYHGLFVEMKRAEGRIEVRDNQREW